MATRSYGLVIVGAGSGNMLRAGEFAGWRIAVVEASRFGGTCLNRGCIPSKMLVHTADVAQAVRHAGHFGIGATWTGADWPAIRDRVFGRNSYGVKERDGRGARRDGLRLAGLLPGRRPRPARAAHAHVAGPLGEYYFARAEAGPSVSGGRTGPGSTCRTG